MSIKIFVGIDSPINFYYIITMDIKSFLNRKGLSQTELASILHTTQASISYWAAGKTTPSLATLKQLIMMGMTLGEIFDAETEAFVLKGKKGQNKKLAADVVYTALVSLVSGDAGKVKDKGTCRRIVQTGLEELFALKAK